MMNIKLHTLLLLLLLLLLFWISHRIQFSHVYSSLSCDVDGNGIKHMLLCCVIMGNMELLHPDRKLLRPSGCEYDNGVDDIQCPKCYVVWNMNMNTHIYP